MTNATRRIEEQTRELEAVIEQANAGRPAPEHQLHASGEFCSCGADTFICQAKGAQHIACGSELLARRNGLNYCVAHGGWMPAEA